MEEEIKEFNIKVDRVLKGGFSLVCTNEEDWKEHFEAEVKEGKVCADCGKPIDGHIDIIPVQKDGETQQSLMDRKYRICKACYATEKYVAVKPKEVESDGCEGCDGSCGCRA